MDILCSICQEHFSYSSSLSSTLCGHVFHTSCIKTAFQYSRSCPYCRKENIQFFQLFIEKRQVDETVISQEVLDLIKNKDMQLAELSLMALKSENGLVSLRKETTSLIRTVQSFKEIATQSKVLIVKYRKLRKLDLTKITQLENENHKLRSMKAVLNSDETENLDCLSQKDLSAMITYLKGCLKNREKENQMMRNQCVAYGKEVAELRQTIGKLTEPVVERVDSCSLEELVEKNEDMETSHPQRRQTRQSVLKMNAAKACDRGKKREMLDNGQSSFKLKRIKVVSDKAKLK